MKRFTSLFTIIILLVLSSCDSPVSNSNISQSSTPSAQLRVPPPQQSYSTKPVRPDTTRKAIWRQFKAANGNGWRIRWNEHTGLPASIFSGLSKKAYRGNAEVAAKAFLADHASLLGISDLNRLTYIKTQTYRGVRHVTFNQTVKGVPVYEAEYKVHLRGNGQVDMANGTLYPNIEVSTSPAISTSRAVTAARSDLDLQPGSKLKTTSKLIIYHQQDQFHLAWKLTLFSKKPFADWFYMVDAQSGEILYKLNQLTDVTGDGDVYPTYPGLSSVTNKPLYGLVGNGHLDGTYANIYNASASRAYAASNSFIYATTNTHFDEVSLYYHIDNFRRNFIENLDVDNNLFNKLEATAHDNYTCPNQPNACFDGTDGNLYFSDTYDFANEDKVIYHEYSHAIIYDIESGIQSEYSEEGAISEGTPDYFAGSFTGRSKILNYAVPFADRDMDNPEISLYSGYQNEQNYPNVEPHDGGEFFSSILWDIYNSSLGKSKTDFLVYDALYRVTANPDFLAFRDAMMAADYDAYNGNDVDDIQNSFADKGVGMYAPPPTPLNLTVTNYQNTGAHPHLTWDSGGGDVAYYNLYRTKLSGSWMIIASPSAKSYTDSGIIIGYNTPNRFLYKVTAVGQNGAESSYAILSDPSFPFFGTEQ